MAFSNRYAPEHLIVNVADAESWLEQLDNAGSVFLGVTFTCSYILMHADGPDAAEYPIPAAPGIQPHLAYWELGCHLHFDGL